VSHFAYRVDWETFSKTLAATKCYDSALESYSPDWPDSEDGSNDMSPIGEAWHELRDRLDAPWTMAFENIFSFEFDAQQLEKDEGNEPLSKSWISKKCSPDDVANLLTAWKEIEFKPLLVKLPKRYHRRYLAMARYAVAWKKIFKAAREKNQGIVICFNWDN
jgi:hypothetical protein